MNQPSKIGPAFLFLFSLPFMGMGAAFIFQSLRSGQANAIPASFFGAGFFLIGLILMIAVAVGWKKLKQQAALKDQNPNSPWLWRDDWAQSRSLGQNRNRAVFLWIGAVVGACVTLPCVYIGLTSTAQKSKLPVLVLAALPLLTVCFVFAAILATLRRERFGKTYFEFDSLPVAPGRTMTGRVNVRLPVEVRHGIDAHLTCIRRITTGSGKEQSTRDMVLWEDERNVAKESFAQGPDNSAVPIAFQVPQDAYETNYDNLRDKVLWILHVRADVPGVDFTEDYEIPVFRTTVASAARSSAAAGAFETSFGGGAAVLTEAPAQAESGAVDKPATTSAVVSTDWNGTQFYFPPLRNPAFAFTLFIFTAIWSGAVYLLFRSNAPLLFKVVFSSTDALLVLAVLYSLFSSTRIRLTADSLVLRKVFLLGPRTQSIAFSDIASVFPVVTSQQGPGAKIWYSLRLTTKAGRKVTLVSSLPTRQEARWLTSQIETAVGLKQDTHVEFDNFYGPPPQRGTPQPRLNPAIAKASGWFVIVFMMIWVAGFAVIIFGAFLHPSRNGKRAISRPVATAAVQPRTFAPLSDADQTRIASLPMQEQAEELLERSLQHQEDALDLFHRYLPEWKGQIKETPRMKRLLERAQYSRDLRVRYAYCDMMLAMDGWSKDSEAVQILVQRAREDAKSRAYDVWFLGMLGGRGVETQQVQTVLMDYASADPDPTVRQWATEGMRFLGTDEALDSLFTIFTTDASLNVRDRAGCNLSDCGNFMRKQRMRMLPGFLELVENPATNPQMRTWSFMAMQGITDVNLPSDASAWRNWYNQHGAEKMAEYQSIPEWQVRGDE